MWIRTFIWCGSRVPKWCRSMWYPDPDPRHCRTVCCTVTYVQVQEAVANCLPPLVPSVKDEAPKLVSELLNTLLTTGSTSTRHLAWGCLEGQGFSVNFILINYCLNLQLYFFLKDVIKSSYQCCGSGVLIFLLDPNPVLYSKDSTKSQKKAQYFVILND